MEQKSAAKIERANKLADRKRKAEGKTTRKEKERIKLGNLREYSRQWKDQGCPDENSPEWLDHLNTVLRLFNDPDEIGKTIDTWSWDCITVKYLDIERQSLEFLENEELEDHYEYIRESGEYWLSDPLDYEYKNYEHKRELDDIDKCARHLESLTSEQRQELFTRPYPS